MIMNEHIQELISAYLHRGSTPAQEKELFEACKNDPATAEHLRQHLILSLKLRGLRDDVSVDSAVHAALERRIDAIELPADPEEVRPAALPDSTSHGGFRLAHLFGSGLAAAAVAVVIMMLLPAEPELDLPTATAEAGKPADTVYVIERDTVQQVREIERPVYIVRNVPVEVDATDPVVPADQEKVTENLKTGYESTPPVSLTGDTDPLAAETEPTFTDTAPVSTSQPDTPLFVDTHPATVSSLEQKTKNYLDQYNAMLVSVESVRLTAQDRISN